jgi:hypothetical protein
MALCRDLESLSHVRKPLEELSVLIIVTEAAPTRHRARTTLASAKRSNGRSMSRRGQG